LRKKITAEYKLTKIGKKTTQNRNKLNELSSYKKGI